MRALFAGALAAAGLLGLPAGSPASDRMGPMRAFTFSSYAPSWQPLAPFGG